MEILVTCFKGATYPDKYGRLYRAKTTCLIRKTPKGERYFLTDGLEVSKHTCLELISNKKR